VLRERRVSVTPLHYDLTDRLTAREVGAWELDGFRRFAGVETS
jgi:hypothetical protein